MSNRDEPATQIHDGYGSKYTDSKNSGSFQAAQPYLPPVINRATVTWNNNISMCSTPVEFVVDSETHTLQLIPWFEPDTVKACLLVTFKAHDIDGLLVLSDWPQAKSIERFLPIEEIDRLPDNLRTAVIEAAYESILEKTEMALSVPLRILDITPVTGRPISLMQMHVGFTLTSQDSNTVKGILSFNESFLPIIGNALNRKQPSYTEHWSWLQRQLYLQVGYTTISCKDLENIEPGDILISDDNRYAVSQQIWVRVSEQCIVRARIEQNQITIATKEDDELSEEDSNDITSIDDLSVRLVFDIGEKTITYQELKQLQPGYTFEIDQPLEELVRIRSNNQTIGVGELVQIEDQMGIRILKLFGQESG